MLESVVEVATSKGGFCMDASSLPVAVGEQVVWASQANGYETEKRGRLLALVPPEAHIADIAGALGITFSRGNRAFDNWQSKNHRGLVAVEAGRANTRIIYYAPLVGKLRRLPSAATMSSYDLERVRRQLSLQGPDGATALRLVNLLAELQACGPLFAAEHSRIWSAAVNSHGGLGDGEPAADSLVSHLLHALAPYVSGGERTGDAAGT